MVSHMILKKKIMEVEARYPLSPMLFIGFDRMIGHIKGLIGAVGGGISLIVSHLCLQMTP